MEVDHTEVKIVSVSTEDNSGMGFIIFTCRVEANVGSKNYSETHEINYRPGIEYKMNYGQIPKEYINIKVETECRKDFEKKGWIVKNVGIKW